MTAGEAALREEICEVGRRLYDRGLLGATEGNVSVRIAESRILCTPSGVSKGHLSPLDCIVIDDQGCSLDSRAPSSEIKMHVRIYARRPDCQAVVHAHPPTATGFALAGETIPDDLLPEAALVLGSVALVPFAMPGTDEVPDAIEPFLAVHKTFLLSNHGAVVMGKDLKDAFNRMETLERIAQIVLNARRLGAPQPMPPGAFRVVKEAGLNGRL